MRTSKKSGRVPSGRRLDAAVAQEKTSVAPADITESLECLAKIEVSRSTTRMISGVQRRWRAKDCLRWRHGNMAFGMHRTKFSTSSTDPRAEAEFTVGARLCGRALSACFRSSLVATQVGCAIVRVARGGPQRAARGRVRWGEGGRPHVRCYMSSSRPASARRRGRGGFREIHRENRMAEPAEEVGEMVAGRGLWSARNCGQPDLDRQPVSSGTPFRLSECRPKGLPFFQPNTAPRSGRTRGIDQFAGFFLRKPSDSECIAGRQFPRRSNATMISRYGRKVLFERINWRQNRSMNCRPDATAVKVAIFSQD